MSEGKGAGPQLACCASGSCGSSHIAAAPVAASARLPPPTSAPLPRKPRLPPPPPPLAGKLLADWRRINVAITRSRKKLVLLGDVATLRSIQLFARLAALVQERGWYLQLPADALQQQRQQQQQQSEPQQRQL